MKNIVNAYNFAMTLAGSLILNAIIIGGVVGIPFYFFVLQLPCGE